MLDITAARDWVLQRAAAGILNDRKPVRVDGETVAGYVYRVCMCNRGVHGIEPGVRRSPDGQRAEFVDVMTCGNVWHCRICSGKITTERRAQLNAGMAAWRARDGEVYLLTLTLSHSRAESLDDVKDALRKALGRVKGRRAWRAAMQAAGSVGSIRALEVTHGELNGWHPHTHELIFARPGELGALKRRLRGVWVRYLCEKGLGGFTPSMTPSERFAQLRAVCRHALTLQDGTYAADYVAKFGLEPATAAGGAWGPASELTKGMQKVGKRLTGRTPTELLWLASRGDRRARSLWREFAVSFHGERQLFWSKALRADLLDLCQSMYELAYQIGPTEAMVWKERAAQLRGEISDEQLAARADARCTEFVARIDFADWRRVIATDTRFRLLTVAASGGAAGVAAFLDQLRRRRETHSGEFFDDQTYLRELGRIAA